MQSLAEIKAILDARGLRPKRSLGQNFLIDHNLIRKLVDSSGVGPGSLVLEIGPGTGTMTDELLARECEVIACELDDGLAAALAERYGSNPRFTLIHRDCLEGKHALAPEIIAALRGRPFALIANLPYGAATPVMSTLLLRHPECATLAVTIQREVADRLLAEPGTKDFGPLAVIAQVFTNIRRIAQAPPACFWPRPEVTSSLVHMQRRAEPITTDAIGLSDFLHALFAHRRKQLGGVLGPSVDWARVGAAPGCEDLGPTLRAEQLSSAQVVAMGRALGRVGN